MPHHGTASDEFGETHRGEGRRSLQALLGDALRESATLARKEFELFKAESNEKLRALVLGIVLLVAAAVFAVAAVTLLTGALVAWLAVALGSAALASLIVAVVAALVALGLGLAGYGKLSTVTVAPERTLRSIRRDAAILADRAP